MSDKESEITFEEVYPTTLKYQPHRDDDWRPIEDEASYIHRMQRGPLPNWPEELLREWLYRHASNMEDYAFLGFERFKFELVTWVTDKIPGREAFRDSGFCDNFQNVEERAADNPHDWLAHYMLREGTWNSPVALLDARTVEHTANEETQLKSPYHLLEGHRRLSFLQGLKRLEKARSDHSVWIVSL